MPQYEPHLKKLPLLITEDEQCDEMEGGKCISSNDPLPDSSRYFKK